MSDNEHGVVKDSPEYDIIQLAMFNQKMDASRHGVMNENGEVIPRWVDLDIVIREEYINDARMTLTAVELLGYRKARPE